jgi:hypothetical protein
LIVNAGELIGNHPNSNTKLKQGFTLGQLVKFIYFI